jgi:predicted type IV restriction endonuclease
MSRGGASPDAIRIRLIRQLEEREAQLGELSKAHANLASMADSLNVMLLILLSRQPAPEVLGDPHLRITSAEILEARNWVVQLHPDGTEGDKKCWLIRTPEDGEAARKREAERAASEEMRARILQ